MTGKEWSTWIAEADGSNPRVLVNGISGNLSPGGRWFVYAGTTDRPHLFVRDLASGKTRDLGRTWTHAWSPDGSKVAVSNGKQLLLVDPRGGESQELARGKIWFVSFSPDGKAIVYTNGNIPAEGQKLWTDIFLVRLSGDVLKHIRLTTDGVSDHPVWGQTWIAFTRRHYLEGYGPDFGSVYDLYLMRPDGTDAHRLTIEDETAGHGKKEDFLRFGLVPEGFSSDGEQLLACVTMELGPCEPVAFMVPKGPGQKLVDAAEEGAVWTVALSPDGETVLFEDGGLDDEEHHVIATIPFTGGKRGILLRDATRASWAPAIPSAPAE